jgi:hypothetical protein
MIINETISISQKPEIIWNYLMDVSNDVFWRNGITKAGWTSQPPYGIGSTGEHTHKDMGVMKWKVTQFEAGSSYEFIHTAGGLKGSIAFFKVEAKNTDCLVAVQMSVSGPLIMRMMMLFMRRTMRKGVRGDLQNLKVLLEGNLC